MTPKELAESIKAICQYSADNDGDTSHIEDGISEVCLENIGTILAALDVYEHGQQAIATLKVIRQCDLLRAGKPPEGE